MRSGSVILGLGGRLRVELDVVLVRDRLFFVFNFEMPLQAYAYK